MLCEQSIIILPSFCRIFKAQINQALSPSEIKILLHRDEASPACLLSVCQANASSASLTASCGFSYQSLKSFRRLDLKALDAEVLIADFWTQTTTVSRVWALCAVPGENQCLERRSAAAAWSELVRKAKERDVFTASCLSRAKYFALNFREMFLSI